MQKFQNLTNCAKITITYYHVKVPHMFKQLLTFSHNFLKKYSALTCMQAARCVRHSLIAERVLHLSAGQHSYKHSSSYHIKQPRHQPSGLHYLWHRPIACLPVLCVQNVNELRQHLLDVWDVMKQSIISSAINEWCMSLRACLRLKEKF